MIPGWDYLLWALAVYLAWGIAKDCLRRIARPDIRLRSADWGEVYVLQDVLSPKLLKVGMTTRSAAVRGRKVSRDMTGGRELRCRRVIRMPFVSAVEKEAHRLLSRYGDYTDRGTEWFRVSDPQLVYGAVDRAARTVRRVARLRRRWSVEAEQDVRLESTPIPFMLRSPGGRRP